MANKTAIEWADYTINPIVGCSKCSPGCDNCYAERTASRLTRMKATADRYGRVMVTEPNRRRLWNGKTDVDFSVFRTITTPKPKRVFVGSMGDIFHESVSQDDIDALFNYMSVLPQHTFMLLTKRPDRMRDAVNNLGKRWLTNVLDPQTIAAASRSVPTWPIENVWLGVTVENQDKANERIPTLLSTPAANRFVSVEPMLGEMTIKRWLNIAWQCSACRGYFTGEHQENCPDCGSTGGWCGSHIFNGRKKKHNGFCPSQSGIGIDWVICGGETGPRARPMHPDWPRRLRDECQAAKVPFFFKSWGEWHTVYDRDRDDPNWGFTPTPVGTDSERYLNIAGGHGFHGERVVFVRRASRISKEAWGGVLDGREWREFPE